MIFYIECHPYIHILFIFQFTQYKLLFMKFSDHILSIVERNGNFIYSFINLNFPGFTRRIMKKIYIVKNLLFNQENQRYVVILTEYKAKC